MALIDDAEFYRGRSDAFEKRAFEAEAEVERLREALEKLADSEHVARSSTLEWAVWAHKVAREALEDDDG